MGIVVGSFDATPTLAELLDKVEAGEPVTITRRGKAVAELVRPKTVDEQAERRALIEEIRRWRVGKDRGAKPGSTIRELIRAGRKY